MALATAPATRTCTVEGCDQRYRSSGLCDTHYWARRTTERRERRLGPIVVEWSPLCMTAEEWADWRTLNPRFLAEKRIAERPCRDCPAAWAAVQRAQGTCNGQPGRDS